jgi:alpha-ketoglutarate-dependent taurine dioxygenase
MLTEDYQFGSDNLYMLASNAMQSLAQDIKSTLTNTHAASSTAAPDQAGKHKKLLQDFATILQVSVTKTMTGMCDGNV